MDTVKRKRTSRARRPKADETKRASSNAEQETSTGTSNEKPEADEQEATRTAAVANNFREVAGAGYLYASLCGFVGEKISPDTYVNYFKQLLRECGTPHDPIEIMIVEQLALAHHNVGRLYAKSALAGQHEEAVAYVSAAARLAGEFRRTAIALNEYRGRANERLRVVADECDSELKGQRAAGGAEA